MGLSAAVLNAVGTAMVVPVTMGFLGQSVSLKGVLPFVDQLMPPLHQPGNPGWLVMLLVLIALIALKNAFAFGTLLISEYLARTWVRATRAEAIQLLLNVDLDFYTRAKVGDLVTTVSGEITNAGRLIQSGLSVCTVAIATLVLAAVLIALSWQLTLVSGALLLAVSALNHTFVTKSKQLGERLSRSSRNFGAAVFEVLSGIRLVKVAGGEERELTRLKELIAAREEAELKSQLTFSLITPANEVVGMVALIVIVLIGHVVFVSKLQMMSAALLTYLFVLFRLLPLIGQLNGLRSQYAHLAPSLDIVYDFLRKDDKPVAKNGSVQYEGFRDGIRFQGVSFIYPQHSKIVLDNFDMWMPRGATIALVGPSGGGKSTVAELLPRFYDPTSGRITVDGRDLRDLDVKSWRAAIGIVSQDTFLFNDSVRNNILYARPDASEADLLEAARRAHAAEFIEKLPNGYDTTLGDRGILLSGGQRQRIAIARALLRNPDILILDEATSALDTLSEELVRQALEELSKDRTTLVIAHRLSTVQKADQIIVLVQGRVLESGTHDELVALKGHYTRLYERQFAKQEQAETTSV